MKKMMMIAAMMVAVLTANAQEAGQFFLKPMVGGTLATLTGDSDVDKKMKLGLVAGAEAGYMLSDQFGVTAGLLYSQQGSKGEGKLLGEKYDVKVNTEYLNVPIMANFYIIPGLAIKAGAQVGFLTKGKEKINKVEVDVKDNMNKVDFSIPMGISYEFYDFVIDARYNLGLTNVNKKDDDFGDVAKQRNSYFMLTVGYKIQF